LGVDHGGTFRQYSLLGRGGIWPGCAISSGVHNALTPIDTSISGLNDDFVSLSEAKRATQQPRYKTLLLVDNAKNLS
jgi:hypothetical protein